jgi:alpha-L-fucosidase
MRKRNLGSLFIFGGIILLVSSGFFSCKQSEKMSSRIEDQESQLQKETKEEHEKRMAWWREARFGLFIHWGLYAIPAGEWKGETNHAEWILTTAQIPVKEYEKFALQFNPEKFDAKEWVKTAKDAGMKYIVITSKHHDGFCLFDSKMTEYDVVDATPFKRDILKELAEECHRQNMKICWYHSIMDWHHSDYLPRRDWETRSAEGADFDRYVNYMKGQVKELLTNYGKIGVMWFDGEWEYTWTRERGEDLYRYVRSIAPNVIINNRVGKGRAGMAGTYDPETASGDFGTPEQEIPATGLEYDWETCMTMNDHWGYNKNDQNWKSEEDLIRKLVDIASKGGNFLLNVGSASEGLFPEPSVKRLAAIGEWMRTNGESIYGTSASLFEKLDWGRSTTKGNRLFLFVFEWPEDGKLSVPGLISKARKVYLLERPQSELGIDYRAGTVVISLPKNPPDPSVSVITLEFPEKPEIVRSPRMSAESDIFYEDLEVTLSSDLDSVELRYTLDGSNPTRDSLIYQNSFKIDKTTTVKAQIFRNGQAVSSITAKTYRKVPPRPASKDKKGSPGLTYAYYHGQWESLPDFKTLTPEAQGILETFNTSPKVRKEHFAFLFKGSIMLPETGLYTFYVSSDDGSRLYIGNQLVVDNDGLHGPTEAMGRMILEKGLHPLRVDYFQRSGGEEFIVSYSGPGISKQSVPPGVLSH